MRYKVVGVSGHKTEFVCLSSTAIVHVGYFQGHKQQPKHPKPRGSLRRPHFADLAQEKHTGLCDRTVCRQELVDSPCCKPGRCHLGITHAFPAEIKWLTDLQEPVTPC